LVKNMETDKHRFIWGTECTGKGKLRNTREFSWVSGHDSTLKKLSSVRVDADGNTNTTQTPHNKMKDEDLNVGLPD